jgi:hypothetical protein
MALHTHISPEGLTIGLLVDAVLRRKPHPINIFANVKTKTADRNKTFKLVDVQQLVSDATDKVTVEDWERCVRHTDRLQEEDL